MSSVGKGRSKPMSAPNKGAALCSMRVAGLRRCRTVVPSLDPHTNALSTADRTCLSPCVVINCNRPIISHVPSPRPRRSISFSQN